MSVIHCRFIIKELSRLEKQSFLDTAPLFLSHWAKSVETRQATSLAKILGLFQVCLMAQFNDIGAGYCERDFSVLIVALPIQRSSTTA